MIPKNKFEVIDLYNAKSVLLIADEAAKDKAIKLRDELKQIIDKVTYINVSHYPVISTGDFLKSLNMLIEESDRVLSTLELKIEIDGKQICFGKTIKETVVYSKKKYYELEQLNILHNINGRPS